MKAIEYKNETADDILNQILALRFAQGLIKDLITQRKADDQPNISIIGILMDYHGTLSKTIKQLETKRWLISNDNFGAI